MNNTITNDDVIVIFGVDGLQLYKLKQSDCWLGIYIVMDFNGSIWYGKDFILPEFVVPGPNLPKNHETFLFPTFHHLSACQHNRILCWDTSADHFFHSCLFLFAGTADTVRMRAMNGWVGHHGRNGCRIQYGMPGHHKPNQGFYPVMLQPTGWNVPGCDHPDVNVHSIQLPTVQEYQEKLNYVLGSLNITQYRAHQAQLGIVRPSILSGLPFAVPPLKCFPPNTMHHFGLNLGQLLILLWHGTIEHSIHDNNPENWRFKVLVGDAWTTHGQDVADTLRYIPTCIENRTVHNPVLKLFSGFKASQYMIYLYGLCPVLLYGVLPELFYSHFCSLAYAV